MLNVKIMIFALFHHRSQEIKNSSSVMMQEDSTRTQYKPQVLNGISI